MVFVVTLTIGLRDAGGSPLFVIVVDGLMTIMPFLVAPPFTADLLSVRIVASVTVVVGAVLSASGAVLSAAGAVAVSVVVIV